MRKYKTCMECIYWQQKHSGWGICTHEKVLTGYYMHNGHKIKHTAARYKNDTACKRRFVEKGSKLNED